MNFHVVFNLNGNEHHERGFTEPQHAAEAMLNWERFSKDHSTQLTEGDATILEQHYSSHKNMLHAVHNGTLGPVIES